MRISKRWDSLGVFHGLESLESFGDLEGLSMISEFLKIIDKFCKSRRVLIVFGVLIVLESWKSQQF